RSGTHFPYFSISLVRLHPRSTLFPYTTLFRSSTSRTLMMPFALDLISTFVIGSTLPVATTDRTIVPRSTIAMRDGSTSRDAPFRDRKSTRLNSSHEWSSYAVFCLKKKAYYVLK